MFNICSVVVLFNPDESVVDNIKKISSQSEKVILVDNGSDDGKLIEIKKILKDDVLLIENVDNLGIATALNIGVKQAIAEEFSWIATFDQDSQITDGYFDSMFTCFYMNVDRDAIRIISPTYMDIRNQRHTTADGVVRSRVSMQNSFYRYVDFSMTSGNLVKSQLFEEIGFFEDKLFIDQVDHDFCLRCINAGYKIVESVKTVLYHNLGDQTVHRLLNRSPVATNHSPLRRYYMSRNRLYMYRRYYLSNTNWVITDIGRFLKEMIIIYKFESRKSEKFKMTLRGVLDNIIGRYGKFNG